MSRFAFYGRVSTEDQQDPASSKGWQLARSRALIEPHDGEVVAEYFDVGQSRSLPWKRRPEAARLLDALRDPRRGFDAVVIGEPARAFYGNQFGLTFPVFVHYGVGLWVPEVGGAIDPGSDAHDLVMSLYGGMSKGERNRIKIRVRTAMATQAASEGRFLGGRPPYGYMLADAGPHPNPGKAAVGQRLHRLEPDPVAAPIVRRIFAEYLAGGGLHAIAGQLTRDGVPCPSAHDPARNRHRHGDAWTKQALHVILRNPRYTGRQVWNKQRREEILLDVEDVASGHVTRLRWNDRSDWIWSTTLTHEAIVSAQDFARVQEQLAAGRHRPTEPRRRQSRRRYLLSGLVRCALCERRMEGSFNNGRVYYRCTYSPEYMAGKDIDHPKTLYLREDLVVPQLDRWLTSLFEPINLDATCARLASASGGTEADSARAEAARRKIVDCDVRLAKYRSALEAGADPLIVSAWIAEVQGARLAAERELAHAEPQPPMSAREIKMLVRDLGKVTRALANADPADKCEVYDGLGVSLTYHPDERAVAVEARPTACRTVCVGGGT